MESKESKLTNDKTEEQKKGPKIKTRTELAQKFPDVYEWLTKNKPELLDKFFPQQGQNTGY